MNNFFNEVKSFNKSMSHVNNCIQFPFYHYVFDDQRKNFEDQIRYMKKFGDFISLR